MKILLSGSYASPRTRTATGFASASLSITESILRYADAEVDCLLSGHEKDPADTLRRRFPRAGIVREEELLYNGTLPPEGTTVIHSVKEDACKLLSLRQTLSRPVPLVFTVHCLSDQACLYQVMLPLLLMPFQAYDAVICTSRASRTAAARILRRLSACLEGALRLPGDAPPVRLECIPIGIDTDEFRPVDRKAARAALGIGGEDFVLLWYGRFSSLYKADLNILLRSVRCVMNELPDQKITLLMAGDARRSRTETESLRREADRLGLGGAVRIVDDGDVPSRRELYGAADVFTSPADNVQETYGLTPVEAMACGIPQLVSDWDGYRDTVADGETGFRVPAVWTPCMDDDAAVPFLPLDDGIRREIRSYHSAQSVSVDMDGYIAALRLLITDPDLRSRMAKASRVRALAYYSQKRMVGEYEGLWRDLSEAAKKTEPRRTVLTCVPGPDPCRDFSCYPSVMLDGTARFSLSSRQWLGLPASVRPDLSDPLPETALEAKVLDFFRLHPGAALAEAESFFSGSGRSAVRRTVMRLYKLGLLTWMREES